MGMLTGPERPHIEVLQRIEDNLRVPGDTRSEAPSARRSSGSSRERLAWALSVGVEIRLREPLTR